MSKSNNSNQISPPALQQQAQSSLQGLGGTGAAQAALSQQQVYSQYPTAGPNFNGPWISSTDQLLIEIRDMLKRGKSRMG